MSFFVRLVVVRRIIQTEMLARLPWQPDSRLRLLVVRDCAVFDPLHPVRGRPRLRQTTDDTGGCVLSRGVRRLFVTILGRYNEYMYGFEALRC